MQEQEVCKDHMQMIMKGKRTKRQRLPSPLRLTMSTTCSSDNSIGFDLTTTTTSNEFMNRTQEEEDTANCLILLAQGHNHHHHHIHTPTKPSHRSSSQSPNSLYECKTCNRCFPSFQALGGHRASHKKPKANIEEKQGVTTTSTFVNELGVDHHDCYNPTSTTLTLQLSSTNKGLYNNTKSKVHECSICGAEFSSGQALGGHMRRHRNFVSNPIPTTTISMSGGEAKKHKDVLDLDLNLPAPDEDDHSRDSKLFPFQSKDKVIVFSATSLVDCHY